MLWLFTYLPYGTLNTKKIYQDLYQQCKLKNDLLKRNKNYEIWTVENLNKKQTTHFAQDIVFQMLEYPINYFFNTFSEN